MIKGKPKPALRLNWRKPCWTTWNWWMRWPRCRRMTPLALSAVVRMVLGPKRKALYEHLRTEDGRVPVSAISQEIMDIF